MINRFPFIGFILAQLISIVLLKCILVFINLNIRGEIALLFHCLMGSLLALQLFKLPKWFLIISIVLPISIYYAINSLNIGSTLYGIIFIFLVLTFSHTIYERVPLYLTNNKTELVIKSLYIKYQKNNPVDLGAGLGGVTRVLNGTGVENAPFVFMCAKIHSVISRRGIIKKENIWKYNLSSHDFVYTFLSTAVMDDVLIKAQKELNTGSILISNSFPLNSLTPIEEIVLNDRRQTRLFVYQF